MHRTCVIIVNWNCWPLTRACLEAVAVQTRRPALTVVVDNASKDLDSEEVLAFAGACFKRPVLAVDGRTFAPEADFVLVRLDRNLGWGAGNNAALNLALLGRGVTGFWFLNPDTVASSDCLEALERYLDAHLDVGAAGATVLKGPVGDRLECAAGCRYLHQTTVVLPAHAGVHRSLAARVPEPRIDYVLGACMYVRRQVFERIGLFASDGLLYYEEADFCLRARRAGWKLGWCRSAVARHLGGGCLALALPDERERKRLANYHENLGALRFAWKRRRRSFPLALAARVVGKLGVLAWRRELYLAGPLFSALRDFVLGRAVTGPGPAPGPRSRCARSRDR